MGIWDVLFPLTKVNCDFSQLTQQHSHSDDRVSARRGGDVAGEWAGKEAAEWHESGRGGVHEVTDGFSRDKNGRHILVAYYQPCSAISVFVDVDTFWERCGITNKKWL